MEQIIQTIAIAALPVIFAITVHEAAHGYVARYFGDSTAWLAGRISLNPIRHIDPVGTILIPGLLLLVGAPFLFGYAKPVPVDFGRLRHPKRDMLWVAAAGPAANFAMAIAWCLLMKIAVLLPLNDFSEAMIAMGEKGVTVNAVLMVLNLFPLPPLDGGRIAVSLLPMRLAIRFARIEPWGFFILLALLYFHILEAVLGPFVNLVRWFIFGLFGLL